MRGAQKPVARCTSAFANAAVPARCTAAGVEASWGGRQGEGRGGGGGGDNDDRDTDGTDNAGTGNLPPTQMSPSTINVRGTGSCLIHDFLGIAGFEQCLVVLRLVDDGKDEEGLPAPQ